MNNLDTSNINNTYSKEPNEEIPKMVNTDWLKCKEQRNKRDSNTRSK